MKKELVAIIKKGFKKFLICNGYAKNTAYSYMRAVMIVAAREQTDLLGLVQNISNLVKKYGPSGNGAAFGKKSHNTYINALRRFEEFVNS